MIRGALSSFTQNVDVRGAQVCGKDFTFPCMNADGLHEAEREVCLCVTG